MDNQELYAQNQGRFIFNQEEEYFQLVSTIWDVKHAKEILNRRTDLVLHEFNVEDWSKDRIDRRNGPIHLCSVHVDYDRIDRGEVDLSVPCIFGTDKINGKEFKFILDGHHRLAKALENGVVTLKGALLTYAETQRCLFRSPFR